MLFKSVGFSKIMNKFSLKVWCRSFSTTKSLLKLITPSPESTCPKPDYGPPTVHRAEFLNGMKVAAAKPMGGDISACTIMFQVGSAHEFNKTLGATHFIRAASTASGLAHSGFIRSRYLQQEGGYITCTSDRQTISFTLRCPAPIFGDLKSFLTDAAARCQYAEHELDDARKLVREDLDRRPPAQHVIDLVQKACFDGPFSNSIYCEEGRINDIDSDVLNDYAGSFFKTNVCSIGSANVCYSETMKVASQIDCNRTDKPYVVCLPVSCPRGGYEFYDTGPGVTYMAFAVPGAGTCDYCCLLKHSILAAACGIDNVHRGGDITDRTPHQPLGMLTEEENDIFTDYKAFNISYLNSGCFGILVKTHSKMARCAAFKAAEFLGRINQITCSQIEVGKRRLKLGVMLNDDSCVRHAESLALQMANNVMCNSAIEMGHMIDKISAEEVLEVAKCIAQKRCGGQMAMAVVGDVEAAPHDGELRCY